jgi:hypothetical protein
VENMLGTNPLTFGMPTDEPFPFMLDCATSITQNGKIEYYARIGHDTPEGMVIGRDGKPMTDSVQILKDIRSKNAALAPLGGIGETLGGYKGYGYATVVEILCAALQNGIFLKELEGKDNRNARFVTCICFIDETGKEHLFTGIWKGVIAAKEEGTNGFGYDPIFISEDGNGKTTASMPLSFKETYSHRAKAVKGLISYLQSR